MSCNEENHEVLERHFEGQWAADAWAHSAENLRRAAEILFSTYRASMEEDGKPINVEDMEMNVPATLLYGYAMENAIKACLIKKLKLNSETAQQVNGWKSHDLDRLFGETGIEAKPDQRRLLKAATKIIVWAGKYPVSFSFEGFILGKKTDPETCIPGDLPPRSCDAKMRQSLDELFNRLLDNNLN